MPMSAGDRGSDSGPANQSSNRHQPLLIVNEQGRHTEESRRIVRAQAARASAAQSRLTRARNRGERETTARDDSHVTPAAPPSSQPAAAAQDQPAAIGTYAALETPPLALWLPSIVGGATGAIAQQAVGAVQTFTPQPPQPQQLFSAGSFGFRSPGAGEGPQSPSEAGKVHLPLALPRGFAALQQRITVSDALLGLLSRTACIDFASPGVEQRLHQLLFDLIANIAGSALALQPCHPIQAHLRVACTCLTIFQGQRANGQVFAQDRKYQYGLEAAWSEAILLDQRALSEPKAAEASLWAVFMITVTTGSTATFFHQQLFNLLQDLQLQYWEQVRKVLLDFIYPVSFLDEPCKVFYDSLRQAAVAAG
ncbi:hypothetical protein BAUCODRAFT_162229 [Baudoinia panamericana UAMH 10762]|uniref:Uncharacterized protein n=1 Tax=Baudoinia panamericana (strain UAMH 10762) TaxID=717646 RepID=M2M060_BAUPA|nr:uncharacterized protein BAUCODRAFT_162229 [Baudoinia panamericana UAMH 10762]EMD00373.1 hypothetical protein BAUCODRAFT_162229 [Baudoinia panamericana UAMH 10762]